MHKLLRKIIRKIFPVAVVALTCVVSAGFFYYMRFMRDGIEGKPGRKVIRLFDFSSDSDLDFWEEKALAPGKTVYELFDEDGGMAVKATSDGSASALFFKDRIPHEGGPYVSWEWKAGVFPARISRESLSDKEEFDFVAQFYVIFYSNFYLNAEAIQYVWAENIPPGTVADSPYTKKVKIMVLESGPSDKWKHEMRDISEDYLLLFGKKLDKDIMAVSFMTDADSTDTRAVAYFDNIEIGNLDKEPEIPGQIDEGRERSTPPDSGEEVERGTEISVKTDNN